MEFFVNTTAVSVHGVGADAEFVGDLFTKVSLGEEVEDLFLSFGKLAQFILFACRRRFAETLDDLAGDAAAHGRSAFVDFAEGGEKLIAGSLFEKISGGTGFESFEDSVGVFVDRDHDELDFRYLLLETAHAFDAVEAGEVDVRENDVGFILRDSLKCLLPVFIETDESEAFRLLDPISVDASQGEVVFDDGDRDVGFGIAHWWE